MIPRLLLAAVLAVPAQAGDPSACASRAVMVRHAFVPSAQRRHGEVRLLGVPRCAASGCAACGGLRVESVLFSAMLARGLHRIRAEEAAAWPEGSPHHADSRRYLEALDRAAAAVLGPGADPLDPSQPVRADAPVRRLLITFACAGPRARIEISRVELGATDGAGPVAIGATAPLAAVDVSPGYARQDMALMVRAAFGLEPSAADRLLDEAAAGARKEP